MALIQNIKILSLLTTASFILVACGNDKPESRKGATEQITDTKPTTDVKSKKAGDATVVIWELSDPDKLNPLTSTGAASTYIKQCIFSRLLAYDIQTLELIPQTAVARPEIKEIQEGEYAGGMSLTYEIRPEATWDNGKPILASDYVFSIKALKNPKVEAAPTRPYLQFVDDIVIDEANPKKFTIYSKERYFQAEASSGNFYLVPEYVYDPNKIMQNYTIPQLNDPKNKDRLNDDPAINEFAAFFNAPQFEREVVTGSGPYTFAGWKSNQDITLERKKDWWGDKVDAVALKAYPPKLIHKIVSDATTAVTAMKDEGLDVMRGIQPELFKKLQEDQRFNQLYNLSTPDQLGYGYIGFNSKDARLSDKRVRRAFAHLINKNDIIETLYYNMAQPSHGPIHPSKPYCHKGLEPISFDPIKAKTLLEEAGWKDTDGDGLLDKEIDGKRMKMEFEYTFNTGNEIRKNIGLMLKDEAERVGIKINVRGKEWTVFLEDVKKRDFEIMCLAWVQSPGLDDMKQIWHTESNSGSGSNYVGFGSAESDKLIDDIRITLDELKRNELYKKLQEIIYEEQPYVFLYVPSERISIHNRFENTTTSALRPGYKAYTFKLADNTAQPVQ